MSLLKFVVMLDLAAFLLTFTAIWWHVLFKSEFHPIAFLFSGIAAGLTSMAVVLAVLGLYEAATAIIKTIQG